ncbi:hypothetical protein ONZ43_g2935 [Nemania bipapillata]|uniref:Uncharacterized protein n=1 Tax=Nemania bipapillata TaxID=110536 RepID=A0ACC2IYM9_9PEZI|nr:hypothetical protein ONZ43_g2935 [Nemania bipapillata]
MERKASKFRFKSKHSRSRRPSRRENRDHHHGSWVDADRAHDQDGDRNSSRSHRKHKHRHQHHHHHNEESNEGSHRRHKRRRTGSASPTPPNPYEQPPLDPDAAFRESLFDAMADDEGAAYWEGVYGQPIHTYSREERRVGPEGELERMDDDEYAAFVRQKMWEKTHQGLLEERARREARRKQRENDAEAAGRGEARETVA